MHIEVMGVGPIGLLMNRTVAWVCAELLRHGFLVSRQTILSDAEAELKEALARSALVIVVGNSVLKKDKRLVVLPTTAHEMQVMLREEVVPYLLKIRPSTCVQVHLCHLPQDFVDPTLHTLAQQYPSVEVQIDPMPGFLTVVLEGNNSSNVHQFEANLKAQFSTYVFSSSQGKIEEALYEWFVRKKKTLVLAESCTGGQIAAQLVSVSGASNYFLGSLVTYSNGMKEKILGVSEETLKTTGAVSRETALEMLSGIFERTEADYALAITGIAGPSGGSAEKPVGTMWAALGKRGEVPESGTFRVQGDRETQMLTVSNHLLCALWRKISFEIPVFPFF